MSAIIRIAKVVVWFVYAWVTINVALLLLTFLLLLAGANPTASFAEWVYRSTQRSMAPFRGLFEPVLLSDQSVLDTSVLFAAIVYVVAALLLRGLLDWLASWVVDVARHVPHPPVAVYTATPAPAGDGTRTTRLGDPSQPLLSAVLVQRPAPADTDFVASGLDPRREYVLWFESGGRRVAIVEFRPDRRGTARMALPGAQRLGPGTAIGLAYTDATTATHVDVLTSMIL